MRKLYDVLIMLKQEAWDTLGPLALTPTQGAILLVLSRRRRPMCVADIVFELRSKPATVSRALSSLEQKAFIVRAPDPRDGRRVLVYIRCTGKLGAQWATGWLEGLPRAVARLDPEQCRSLARALDALLQDWRRLRPRARWVDLEDY